MSKQSFRDKRVLIHAVKCQKPVVIMKRKKKGVKICHKLGEIQEILGGSRKRAMNIRSILEKSGGLASMTQSYFI